MGAWFGSGGLRLKSKLEAMIPIRDVT
jgi:hypothetical protein